MFGHESLTYPVVESLPYSRRKRVNRRVIYLKQGNVVVLGIMHGSFHFDLPLISCLTAKELNFYTYGISKVENI